jgi:hypothetical protein
VIKVSSSRFVAHDSEPFYDPVTCSYWVNSATYERFKQLFEERLKRSESFEVRGTSVLSQV